MKFIVADFIPTPAQLGSVYLLRDNWNDWFVWQTMRTVIFVGEDGSRLTIGSVKIGRKGMSEQLGVTEIPGSFEELDSSFFSLGQSENYYETLADLPLDVHEQILRGLRDCAFNLSLLEENASEPVMIRSLLRDIAPITVATRYHHLAKGNSVLTPFSFEYAFPGGSPVVDFDVAPGSMPPSNIHVLIGRNGVGKSRCFDNLTKSLVAPHELPDQGDTGQLRSKVPAVPGPFGSTLPAPLFSGLVSVAFSAFDAFKPLADGTQPSGIKYSYIGLKKVGVSSSGGLKGDDELTEEFMRAVAACRIGARLKRWQHALKTLESDPLFNEHELSRMATYDEVGWETVIAKYFSLLSSGHKVVLLTATRLVEVVEERTLILLDEPEGHLHPPLLSAFVRALSDLLVQRNGVAIVATHSPVVLQEVPKDCVWILNRTGSDSRADRPLGETFGENAGILTREVFGLEVLSSGYNDLIRKKVHEANGSYERVLALFKGNLGAEARAIARSLCLAAGGGG